MCNCILLEKTERDTRTHSPQHARMQTHDAINISHRREIHWQCKMQINFPLKIQGDKITCFGLFLVIYSLYIIQCVVNIFVNQMYCQQNLTNNLTIKI